MPVKQVDEQKLETDMPARFLYLSEFIGFSAEDAAVVQQVGPLLGPLIPQIVEKTYDRLLSYDATARHFLPQQSGYDGPVPDGLSSITTSHPQVKFRKEHLSRYLMQLLGRTCDIHLVPYLDMVGKIHTPKAGNPEIDVPLVQMNALMGFMADTLIDIIATMSPDGPTAIRTIRAFSKLLWIQNDFVNRHYQDRGNGHPEPTATGRRSHESASHHRLHP